jgi:hypothetical protein
MHNLWNWLGPDLVSTVLVELLALLVGRLAVRHVQKKFSTTGTLPVRKNPVLA